MKKIYLIISIITLSTVAVCAQGLYKGGSGGGFARASSLELTLGLPSQATPKVLLQWIADPQDLVLINRSGQPQTLLVKDMQGRMLHTIHLSDAYDPQRFPLQLPAGTYLLQGNNTALSWVKF